MFGEREKKKKKWRECGEIGFKNKKRFTFASSPTQKKNTKTNKHSELARIEAQARANAGQPHLSIPGIFSMVVKEQGPAGLFKGVVPRMFLGVWQTLCMVTGAKLLQQYFEKAS